MLFVEFLDSVSQLRQRVFFSAAMDIRTEISLRQQTLYNSWSNAFDLKEKVILEVSNRSFYFFGSSKKVEPKVDYFYCRKAYREWPQIQDPQILTVWNPIESIDLRFLVQLFWKIRRSKSFDLILLLRLLPSDQKHSTRNCIKFADATRFRSECP